MKVGVTPRPSGLFAEPERQTTARSHNGRLFRVTPREAARTQGEHVRLVHRKASVGVLVGPCEPLCHRLCQPDAKHTTSFFVLFFFFANLSVFVSSFLRSVVILLDFSKRQMARVYAETRNQRSAPMKALDLTQFGCFGRKRHIKPFQSSDL